MKETIVFIETTLTINIVYIDQSYTLETQLVLELLQLPDCLYNTKPLVRILISIEKNPARNSIVTVITNCLKTLSFTYVGSILGDFQKLEIKKIRNEMEPS